MFDKMVKGKSLLQESWAEKSVIPYFENRIRKINILSELIPRSEKITLEILVTFIRQ